MADIKNDDIVAIQMALAHQEKTIADLSDVVKAQWGDIDMLKQKLAKAADKISELEGHIGEEDQANVKPPHW